MTGVKLVIVLAFILVSYIRTEGTLAECKWYTWCPTTKCGGSDGASLCNGNTVPCSIKTQNRVRVVVEVNPGVDASIQPPSFSAFCVTVDKVTQLVLNASAPILKTSKDSFIRLHVGYNKLYVTSEKQRFLSSNNDSYVSFFTSTFKMDYGKFLNFNNNTANANTTAIYFDNTCDAANTNCIMDLSQPCVNGKHCGSKITDTDAGSDVSVYVAFDGTDSDFRPLRSSGLLPARLRAFSWWSYYSTVANAIVPQA